MPVIAPEEPQLALARGAALASANAPRYDTSTVGLAYSQDPDGTTVHPIALADDATTFLGDADSFPDTADIASDSDDVPERSKPFLLVGSSLTAIFVAGMMALAIAMVVSVQPTVDQGIGRHDDASRRGGAAYRVAECAARRAAQVPTTVPAPAPAAPPPAAIATARLKVPPAPPPPVLVRNAAPAPAAPPPAPRPPPPVVVRAGDTAAGHPVAATDSSATALLQPGSEGRPVATAAGGHGGGGHGGKAAVDGEHRRR